MNAFNPLRLLLPALMLPMVAPDAAAQPIRLPAPGGEVIMLDERQQSILYRDWHFAPARVEGDWVFISGVVAGARDATPLDLPGFEAALRRAFDQIKRLLEAAGSSGGHVVELQTFHVLNSSALAADKHQHIDTFRKFKDEYITEPYPAWTGVGVADLFPQNGLVEIQVRAKRKR